MRVHHVAVQVRDLERALAFYGDLLGLPVVRRQPHAVWVDAGGVILMLEQCVGAPDIQPWRSERPGLHLLALAMEPTAREAWREKLRAAGIAIERESDYTIYLRDPDGTRVGLSSYPIVSRGSRASR